MGCIYSLRDPRTAVVRYVGYTRQDVLLRVKRHLREARAGVRTYKGNWLRELLTLGLVPIAEVLEEVGEHWQERERFWISSFGSVDALVNGTAGGDGRVGHVVSAEVREKIAATLRGRKLSPAVRARVSAGLRGKKKSPEHVAKLTGLRRSDATRARISAAKKGRPVAASHRRKIAAALRARPFDEARAQQLAQARGAFDEKRATQLQKAREARWGNRVRV